MAPVFLALGLGSGPASAIIVIPPPVITVYDFTGICTDCIGQGKAELSLSDYTLGDPITQANFVSFHYDGTNLLSPFTINNADVLYISGSINGPLPSAQNFVVDSGNYNTGNFMVFESSSGGSWCVGLSCDSDFGSTSSYSLAGPVGPIGVPEPMPVLLLAGGLLAALVARRKRD
jgi:hypothetical protein